MVLALLEKKLNATFFLTYRVNLLQSEIRKNYILL